MADSSQQRVGRVRPPRVQITYDVEDGGAVASRELPLVAGVLTDLSGDSDDPAAYSERKFVEVEQGGVDPLMKRIGPTLVVTVSDELSGADDAEIAASLSFGSMEDFSPMGVATQIPQTRKLLEVRRQLADLYGKVEANDKLDDMLGSIIANADQREQLRVELGMGEGEDGPEAGEGGDS